jgi:hypothetical protein
MTEPGKTEDKAPARRQETQPAPRPQPQAGGGSGGGSGDSSDPNSGVRQAVESGYEARTTVPGHEGVDARLDNRAGPLRPPLEEFPAKPQQIDGPDVTRQNDFTRENLDQARQVEGPVKGMFSPGMHGIEEDDTHADERPLNA